MESFLIKNILCIAGSKREKDVRVYKLFLEKQGKLDKAIQLYIKLSFLNTDKSAYFATKIQQLKGISSWLFYFLF